MNLFLCKVNVCTLHDLLKLQEYSTRANYSEPNDIASIKFTIGKCLSRISAGRKDKRRTVKYSEIDLPLSVESLEKYFPIEYNGQTSVRKEVAISELDLAFGRNWHVMKFPNSTTQKKVIGLVTLHYGNKSQMFR